MRNLRKALGLSLLPVLLVGCASIEGKWTLRSVDPDAARRDFKFESLTLEKDGSFTAEAKEPTTRTVSGVYRYSRGSNALTLDEHDGDETTYDARLTASELKLTDTSKGKIVARFEKVPR